MPRVTKSVTKKSAVKTQTAKVSAPKRKSPSKKDLLTTARRYLKDLARKTVPSLSILKGYKSSKSLYIGLVVAALFFLLLYKRNLFIAATVNSSPINNVELLSRMNDQYRTQTLNQMINEKIIFEEARKRNVIVTESEINDRIAELEKSVGGPETLETLLEQQGQTRSGLKSQLRLQLTVEKIFDKEASVSAEEVNQFLAENQDSLQATTSAEQTEEATEIIKQQKTSQLFQEKFQEWKQQAKVEIY